MRGGGWVSRECSLQTHPVNALELGETRRQKGLNNQGRNTSYLPKAQVVLGSLCNLGVLVTGLRVELICSQQCQGVGHR